MAVLKSGDDGFPPEDVKEFHSRSDKDSGITALHHTLGAKRGQASPGDHIHDGKGCRKIAEGLNLTLTGKLTPGTAIEVDTVLDSLIAILARVIDFKDNRI